jgi:hypothetical protein
MERQDFAKNFQEDLTPGARPMAQSAAENPHADTRHSHWTEKVQVQLAAVLAVAGGYWLLWPLMRHEDPAAALVLLPAGGIGRLIGLVLAAGLIGALTALATVGTRPAGGLGAALLGVGGLSLRSASIRTALWAHQGHLDGMYLLLALEVALLALAVVAGSATVGLVHLWIERARPRWAWRSPLVEWVGGGSSVEEPAHRHFGELHGLRVLWRYLLGRSDGQPTGEGGHRRRVREAVVRHLLFVAVAVTVSFLLAMLLMRSPDRGQVLFAVLASCLAGTLVAHQAFGVPYSLAVALPPIVCGVTVMLLGAVWASPNEWMSVPPQAHALPIDWLSAGGGGAILGYWISARWNEMRHLEKASEGDNHG